MRLWRDLQEATYRFVLATLTFLTSLLISVVLFGSSIALKYLVNFSITKGSKTQEVVEFVLDVSLVGSAVVVSMCGAIIVAGEAIESTRAFFSRNKE